MPVRGDQHGTNAVARVWHPRLGVIGGGFVVGPDLVATCAHVVADAVGADPYAPEAPASTVRVDFPLAGDGAIDAVVARWAPIRDDGSGDVALLRLRVPAPVRTPPVRRIGRLWGHDFRVFGFPEGRTGGVWASGRIRGEQGTRWFQLQTGPGEQRVEPGFSGTPVWESGSGAVVGMTVASIRGDTTAAYVIPIDQVFALDQELLPCPYLGARPFGAEDAAYFYGRDEDIGRLVDAVTRQPLVAVAGPSGVGKSSLIHAGLLPRLRAMGTPIVELRLDADPIMALTAAVADAAPGTVVVLDQFEELAALDPETASALLKHVVAHTGTGQIRAVSTLRWAALDQLDPELAGALDTAAVPVSPLDRAGLREAIVGPAAQIPGLRFEDGLVDRILDDAGAEPGQLPLVAALLADLWEHRDNGSLTLRGYLECGGVAGALAQHADRAVGSVSADERTLRRLFTALAEPGRDRRFLRRPLPLGDLPPEQRDLAETLADQRLLVLTRDTVELAHQALIEHWPRLRDWLTADHRFLSWLAGMQERRRRWETAGRDDGGLLRGAPLAAAVEWLDSRADDLAPADRDYIHRGTALNRRRVRRRRVITAVLTVLLLVVGSLSVLAVQRRDVLADQLATANAGIMGRESLARAPTDPALAAQLALAAWREDPQHPAARDALARAYTGLHTMDAELAGVTTEPIERIVVRGDTALLYAKPHPVVVTGMSGPAPQRHELTDLPPGAAAPVLSPDGRWLAVTLTDRPAVVLRDLTGQQPPRELPGRRGTDLSVPVFTPDGNQLMWFAISADQVVTLQLWDLRGNAEIPDRLGTLPADVTAGWPIDDPDLVLLRHGTYGEEDTRLVVRSVVDGTEVATLPPGTAVAPGGDAALRIEEGPDRTPATVVVGPPSGRGPTRQLAAAEAIPSWSRVSADGGWFVETRTSRDGDYKILRLTHLGTGEIRQATVPSIPDPDASTDPEQRLVSAASLGVVSTGDRTSLLVAQGTSLLRFDTEPVPGAEQPARRATSSLDETTVLARSDTGIAVWDRHTGQRLGAVTGLDPNFHGPVPDGDTVWIMNSLPDGWDVGRYQLPTLRRIAAFRIPDDNPDGVPPTEPYDAVNRIALVRDGDRVVVSNGGRLTSYDATTGRPIGPPVPLGATPREIRYGALVANVAVRPGHPGQVAVKLYDGRTWLLEMPSGRPIRTFETTTEISNLEGPVFDPSGTRMALPNRDRAIEVWDVDRGELVGPPITPPAPATVVMGFQPDGHLMVWAPGILQDPGRVVLIEPASGRETGAMRLPDGIGVVDVDRRAVGVLVGGTEYRAEHPTPPHLRATAGGWRDALCAVADRPFTESERLLLPPGSNPTPPCS